MTNVFVINFTVLVTQATYDIKLFTYTLITVENTADIIVTDVCLLTDNALIVLLLAIMNTSRLAW